LTAIGAALVSVCGIEAWCRWTGSTPTLADVFHAYGLLGPVSRTYEPGKGFGQIMGYLGGGLIFLTLGYPLRKHFLRISRLGSLKTWLDVHIFFGITGTAIITLHMAGHLNGIVALCYYATLMAFASGVVGKFLYVHLPRQVSGREQELGELRSEAEGLAAELETELAQAGVAWRTEGAADASTGASASLVSDLSGLLGPTSRRGSRAASAARETASGARPERRLAAASRESCGTSSAQASRSSLVCDGAAPFQ
jgi:hypothetical protein